MSEHRPGPTQRRRDRPRSARWALRLAYEGAAFHGFQRQPGQPTIEGALVEALVGLGLPGGLSFASRTDAGVHAEGQVVAFRAPETLSAAQLHEGLAARLAPGLRVVELRPAPPRFHPRWSATGRTYRYTLSCATAPRGWHVEGIDPVQLEQALMALRKAPRLDGFTAAGAPPKAAPPLAGLTLEREETRWTMTFVGGAFRRYAIRHMVGLAVDVARGLAPLEAIARAAEAPPPYRGTRAPGDGLTLVAVHYPEGLDPFAMAH